MSQAIEAPDEADTDQIARQLIYAETLVKKITGADLSGNLADLALLQRVLDSGEIGSEATYELQSLGMVLGRVFVNENKDYDWWMVEDEYGRDPAIRLKETSLLLFPLTMISKRVEDGEEVNVLELYKGLVKRLAEIRDGNPEYTQRSIKPDGLPFLGAPGKVAAQAEY
jgi:hypothetical protein